MAEILIAYDFLKELGGLERVMFKQANILSKKNKVTLGFAFVDKKNKSFICKELGLSQKIKIMQLFSGKEEFFLLARSFLRPFFPDETKFDLIISHSFMVSRMAKNRKKLDGTPYIVYLHHPPNLLYDSNLAWVNSSYRLYAFILGKIGGPLIKKWDIEAVRNANLVLVNSKYTQKRIKKIYGIDAQILYPSVSEDFKLMNEQKAKKILKKFNLPERFALLHGRMIKDKRPDWAIKAISEVKEISLVISGTIEEEKKIKELIKSLDLEKRTKIIGRVSNEELVALYNSASCFLMSAPKEDFGLTPIEAMACGCPVIAWDDGAGPSETVIPGKNGFLAKSYNLHDFSAKIKSALNRKWNKKEILRSVDKFSAKNNQKDFNSIISKTLNF